MKLPLVPPLKNLLKTTALVLMALAPACHAQDNPTGAAPSLPTPSYNPLEGVFTPQPQYPTPQTIMNIDPSQPPGTTNQLRGLFTPQPQYPTPQTIMNIDPAQPPGTPNPLKGLFTAQPQYPTPETIMNMDALPKNFVPPAPESSAAAPPAVPAAGQPEAKPAEVVKEAVKKAVKQKVKEKVKVKVKQNQKPAQKPEPTTALNPLTDAIFFMQANQYEKALATLNSYMQVAPNDAQAHYLKAVTLVSMRRFTEAKAEYQKTIDLEPASKLAGMAQTGLANLKQ